MVGVGFEGGYPRSSSMPSLLFTLGALRPKEGRHFLRSGPGGRPLDQTPVWGTLWASSVVAGWWCEIITQLPWASIFFFLWNLAVRSALTTDLVRPGHP